MTTKLEKIRTGVYRITNGPAAGEVVEKSTNPNRAPCCNWIAHSGRCGNDGFTRASLVAALEAATKAN